MNFKINLFGKRIMFDFNIRNNRTEYVEGYTNRCNDGKYIVMLDYDRLNIDWVVPELQRLQEDFALSDFYIFKSSESSYHAVCFDKLLLDDYVTILQNSSVDRNYLKVPLMYGQKIWTLRISDKDDVKIKYLFRVLSKSKHMRSKSKAHIEFLEGLFDNLHYRTDVNDYKLVDKSDKLVFARYPI